MRTHRRFDAYALRYASLRVLRPITIVVLLAICLVPFWYMVVLSVRPIEELLCDPARLWLDLGELDLGTYLAVLLPTDQGGQGFGGFMLNSGIVALSSVVLALAIAIPGAYAIARLPVPGRGRISAVFLASYLFPSIIIAIPCSSC